MMYTPYNAGRWSIDSGMFFNIKMPSVHVGLQDTGYVYTMETRECTHAIENVTNEYDLGVMVNSLSETISHLKSIWLTEI